MSTQKTSRADGLAVLRRGHDEARDLFARLDDEALSIPATIGGGAWSAKDLMAHLEAWEQLALDALQDWAARRRPRFYDRWAQAGDIDTLNESIRSAIAAKPAPEVRRSSAATHQRLESAIDATSDAAWDEAPFFDPPRPVGSLGELIGSILGGHRGLFSHPSDHIPDLRTFVESRGA